jgi:hypothetical protein
MQGVLSVYKEKELIIGSKKVTSSVKNDLFETQ